MSKKLKLTVPEECLVNGKQLSFEAPCDSWEISGLLINNEYYTLVNSIGENICGSGYLWSCNSMVSIILNTTEKKAFIQNSSNVLPKSGGTLQGDLTLMKDLHVYGLADIDEDLYAKALYEKAESNGEIIRYRAHTSYTKPEGSYTGNGGTNRRDILIGTGVIGTVLFVWSSKGHKGWLTEQGGMMFKGTLSIETDTVVPNKTFNVKNVKHFSSSEARFTASYLSIKIPKEYLEYLNQSGVTYYYQVV